MAEYQLTRRASDGSTLCEIGSITKAFTGVLLADMHLLGEVPLEDPLSTHRSGLPNTPGRMSRRELAYALGFRSRDPWTTLSHTGLPAPRERGVTAAYAGPSRPRVR